MPRGSVPPRSSRPSKAREYRWSGCSSALPPDSKLIPGAHYLAAIHHDLQHLLALKVTAHLVLQRGDDLLRLRVDDLAAGRIHSAAVDAEGDPARQVTDLDVGHLFRRHYGGVEDVDVVVGT